MNDLLYEDMIFGHRTDIFQRWEVEAGEKRVDAEDFLTNYNYTHT